MNYKLKKRYFWLSGSGLAMFFIIAASASTALAFTPPPNTVQFTLEGCRRGGTTQITPNGILPNADNNFICQDPAPLSGNDTPYVTGNLGKGWNELDLVPHRLIVKNGNSGSTITYNILIAADYKTAGKTGYDLVTEPEVLKAPDTLNLFSDASCQVTSVPQAIQGGKVTGGADEVIYRVLTVTQGADSTCVIDWANRLAVGAHEYPGSSLQSYMFEQEDFSTGKRTVSIPVKDILPQELNKDMAATKDTDFTWNASKTATPATLDLGNTCDPGNANSGPVKIRVEWKILPGVDGKVTAVTNIYANNPAARSVTLNVSDIMFGDLGTGNEKLDTAASGDIEVPANTANFKVFEHIFDAPVNVANLSDTATATYIDTATGIPVQGETQATAFASIQPGTQTNTTALVTDEESISGNGVQYSADSVSLGSATGSFTADGEEYLLGTHLDKDSPSLLWTSATQNGNLNCTTPEGCPVGYVEFNKTIYVDPVPAVTNGTLSDTAKLTASDGFTAPPVSASINISTNALVQLTIVKQLTDDILQGDDQACFTFNVIDTLGQSVWEPEICFNAGDSLQKEVSKAGLLPAVYTVTESPTSGWTAEPAADIQQQVDFANPLTCAKTVTFTNRFAPNEYAHAQVKKVSRPAGLEAGWAFDLQRCAKLNPADCSESDYETIKTLTTSGAESKLFMDGTEALNLAEGTYRINEVTQPGWEAPVAANCKNFVVDYPGSIGATFSCTYTNTKLGKIIINKETDPANGTGFVFSHNIDASGLFNLDDGGRKVFEDVPAGNYTVTETDPTPNYDLIKLVCTDDAEATGWNIIDSSNDLVNRKAAISLDPGETVECTYTNQERGMVELLKLTDGVENLSLNWHFILTGEQVNAAASTPPTLLDFGRAKLIPGVVYRLCETGLPAAWGLEWQVDSNDDGVADTIIPMLAGVNNDSVDSATAWSRVYDPNYVAPPAEYVNDTRCVNFMVNAGEKLFFQLNNQSPPGGEPRTIGYWKNWNTCTNGHQAETAAANGGPAAGWYILDDLLNDPGFIIGVLPLGAGDCEVGAAILNKSVINSGKKMARDAAYNMAAQLLAAELNLSAGAKSCPAVIEAVNAGQALLRDISFNGSGNYLQPKKNDTTYQDANKLEATLDTYNNGLLCP